MGSVHREQVNDGRGTHETFDYITFSDPRVVEKLIRMRHKADAAYSYREMDSGGSAAMVFNESVLATYISLDAMIKDANLTPAQDAALTLIMRGWSDIDIAEYYGVTRQTVHEHFLKAVKRIVAANNRRWEKCFGHGDTDNNTGGNMGGNMDDKTDGKTDEKT